MLRKKRGALALLNHGSLALSVCCGWRKKKKRLFGSNIFGGRRENKIAAVLPSPLPPRLFFFFFCTLKVFVLMPSVLQFSALLKHFHGSDEIKLLGLGFKKYICMCLCLAV